MENCVCFSFGAQTPTVVLYIANQSSSMPSQLTTSKLNNKNNNIHTQKTKRTGLYQQTMPSRSDRKAALARFRSAKRKRELGETQDAFEGNIREEDDVYDIVEEEDYKSLVESRRQREDFVVDDGKKNVVYVC